MLGQNSLISCVASKPFATGILISIGTKPMSKFCYITQPAISKSSLITKKLQSPSSETNIKVFLLPIVPKIRSRLMPLNCPRIWYCKINYRALAFFGSRPNVSIKQVNKAFCYCQSKTTSLIATRRRCISL